MSKKYKKSCKVLNYTDHLLIVISTITGFGSMSVFGSLLGISTEIATSATRLKICAITPEIKNHKSIIKKKKKNHDKIVLIAKSKLNSTKDLISKALIDSNNSHDKFVLINKVLNEFYDMKEEKKPVITNNSFKLYI